MHVYAYKHAKKISALVATCAHVSDYSVVCVGGDGTVNGVVSALLNRANKVKKGRRGADVLHFSPAALPVGIIPTGVCNSLTLSIP